MSQLLQIPIKIHGLWHAGNYDPNDFLGRLINDQWVKTFEKSLAEAIDYNWFASDDHLQMFRRNFGYGDVKCFRTGWPMEYLNKMFTPKKKEDIHRAYNFVRENFDIFKGKLEIAKPKFDWIIPTTTILSLADKSDDNI